jgi:hypothetical protein
LVKAGFFLGCLSLLKVAAAKYAAFIYFEDNIKAFEDKCKQLGISGEITVENLMRYTLLYPCMNN